MSKELPEMTPHIKKVLMLKDLLCVQNELQAVVKSSKNPFFKSSYADLNAHIAMVKPLLAKYGFILEQPTTVLNGANGFENAVISRVIHTETGEARESVFLLPANTDMQKLGGAVTYARRYTLSALLGMQAEDDDANKATGKTKAKRTSELF